MKLVSAALGNNRKPVKTAKGPRYQVRWYVTFPSGLVKEKKKTSFYTVGEAKLFIEQLRKAHFGADGWHFAPDATPTDVPVVGATVVEALLGYTQGKWFTDWSDKQRTKVIGRFAVLVASTLRAPRDQETLLRTFTEQRLDRGPRPAPTSPAEWAGRWLRDVAFYHHHTDVSGPELLGGRAWVLSRSKTLGELDRATMDALRTRFTAGFASNTGRTYWGSVVVPFFTWLLDTNQIERSLTSGQKKIRRDAEGERADPRRIPNPTQVEELAAKMHRDHGGNWDLFVLIGSYCALRAGEVLAIRTNSFFYRADGRLMLQIDAQEKRSVRAANDIGATRSRTGTKERKGYRKPPRLVPVPAKLAASIHERLGSEVGVGTRYLFVGPRGAVGNYDTVRVWWTEAVAEQFDTAHHLAGITPHSMRHAGMTWWFAAGYDQALIQKWGGWASLKVMQDTYRGVLDDIESVSLAGLDRFEGEWSELSAKVPNGADAGVVVNMAEWSKTRPA